MLNLLFGLISYAHAEMNPVPFPVFLKQGFSTVLQFEESPTKVVLGDSASFTVEKLDSSLVIRASVPYATGNMFVYFKGLAPKLVILNASEDADPTYYYKFKEPKLPVPPPSLKVPETRSKITIQPNMKVSHYRFNGKKDYLIIEAFITAGSYELIRPKWDLVRLTYKEKAIAANQLWSERKTVQKDSRIKFRLVFATPNIPKNMKAVRLIVPAEGLQKPFSVLFGGGK